MKADEIRKRFLDFFVTNGHAAVASSSLVPSDPSVLLTTAGMQQFKPYYTGEVDAVRDFGAKSTASCQKSFRTSDIDEVGDERHLTFFEMLGNFSFGGYEKREAITLAFDFITKEMALPISYVTVFEGSHSTSSGQAVPRDEESAGIWKELGVTDVRYEGMEDVFWGPTGSSGPCGPTTEIYCKSGSGEDTEIWNVVFNQFFYNGSREDLLAGAVGKELKPLAQFGVDTGMGLERLVMVSQGTKTVFETDLFLPLITKLPTGTAERTARIFADHARAIAFLVSDGVRPMNKGAGYVLRRLMRRIIAQGMDGALFAGLTREIFKKYAVVYPELNEVVITGVFNDEYVKFQKTMAQGAKELGRMDAVTPQAAFKLFESYGLPYEAIKEMAPDKTASLTRADFDKEFEKHQAISRAGAEKKFGGHGLILDTGELKAGSEEELKKVTRLHTATHLLQQALRDVLGSEVEQRGSDITVERTRFDFSFARKVTAEELKKVEDIVNARVKEDLPMTFVEMPLVEAKKTGALYYFKEKYPDTVKVYYVGTTLASAYSKEFCGGPHVTHTSALGVFKIIKEEAVSQGIRRIRATVE